MTDTSPDKRRRAHSAGRRRGECWTCNGTGLTRVSAAHTSSEIDHPRKLATCTACYGTGSFTRANDMPTAFELKLDFPELEGILDERRIRHN